MSLEVFIYNNRKKSDLFVRCFFLSLFVLAGTFVKANVRLPAIIGNNMVLQQDKSFKIWGWATAGERITLSLNRQERTVKTGMNGTWEVQFSPMKKAGPFEMVVKGNNTITVKNILIGEVWLCSGQSNMEWPLKLSSNFDNEIEQASFNEIRFFQVAQNVQFKPAEDILPGEWKIVTPSTIKDFSAVAYYFGKEIFNQYKFPVGLIGSYWGGTDIESWMSKESIASVKGFEHSLDSLDRIDEVKLREQNEEKRKKIKTFITATTDGIVDGKALWADPDMNDQRWETIQVPGLWEQSRLPDFDGVVWYRKTIELTKEQIAGGATLYLGMIDDSDKSWVNGKLVGQTEQKYNEIRKYKIPEGCLREGKNVITIRIEDTGGGGGIWGDKKLLKLETVQGAISLVGEWKFQISPIGFRINNSSLAPNMFPTILYNGMIHPITNYALRGVIWYQGENNDLRAKTYGLLFPKMIADWRFQFNNKELVFLYTQLANYKTGKDSLSESPWAELRESQNRALRLPLTGSAITIDIGDPNDIHPRNKKDVGYRLSLAARKIAYKEELVCSGPVYTSMIIKNDTLVVSFNSTGKGLMTKDKYGYVKGFQVAGNDRKFHWAKAWIDGDNVIVHSEKVKNPVALRYAWSDNPEDANLYNIEGLPAGPFRTDEWPGITK